MSSKSKFTFTTPLMSVSLNAPLLLASKSPRRADLLRQAGYQFEVFPLELSEIANKNLSPPDQCLDLACFKMKHFIKEHGLSSDRFFCALTCDTMVEFEGKVLGKPKNLEQAEAWLLSYSEKSQWVHTGCSLLKLDGSGNQHNWVASTKVHFKKVTQQDVEAYLKFTSDVLSKAGGYGIQDKHFKMVSSIEGEFANVVGLPLLGVERFLAMQCVKKDGHGAK